MNLKDLSKPLTASQVDFRVMTVNKGGYASILAYKDARCDMQRLDDVCTPLGWKREHSRDNHNCTVSIWDADNKHWVSKEDTGTESNAEAQKGLASDSFKRACFNLGIGRELYDYPVISIKLKDNEHKDGKPIPWVFKLKEWKWINQFDADGNLTFLAAKDDQGAMRFKFGEYVKPEAES
jgi:hypothetical protein